jgi:iron complex outermembrane receptor protein
VAVTGAVAEKTRFDQDWLLIGTSSQAHTVQDHAKLKLAWRLQPALRASYTLGFWDNSVERQPVGWLQDASGQRVDIRPDNFPVSVGGTRAVAIDGRSYTLSAADFGRTRERLQHVMHGLALRQTTRGVFDWQLAPGAERVLEVQVAAIVVEPGVGERHRRDPGGPDCFPVSWLPSQCCRRGWCPT